MLLSGRGSNFVAWPKHSPPAGFRARKSPSSSAIAKTLRGSARADGRGIPARIIPSKGRARNLRPHGGRGAERGAGRPGVPGRIHAPALALFRRGVSGRILKFTLAAALFSGTRGPAPGARIRREIQRLHRAFRGRKSRRRPHRRAGHRSCRARRHGETLAARILAEEHRIYTEAVRCALRASSASKAAACCPTSHSRTDAAGATS